MTDVVFIDNKATNGNGGALFARGVLTLSLSNAVVASSTVKHDGAGIWIRDARLWLSNASVAETAWTAPTTSATAAASTSRARLN